MNPKTDEIDLGFAKVTYELLFAQPNGHRLFHMTQNVNGTLSTGYAIADNSGALPHQTEDGILTVDLDTVIDVSPKWDKLVASVVVTDTDGDPSYVLVDANLVLALKQHAGRIRVDMTAGLGSQVSLLRGLFPALFAEEPVPFMQLERDEKIKIIQKMLDAMCGHFMTKVADAWFVADTANKTKIERAFGHVFMQYR